MDGFEEVPIVEQAIQQPQFTIEEVTDPAAVARFQAAMAQFERNSNWLQAHWEELLPQALGKFVAVAGAQAFLAETPAEAWTWTKTAHPQDQGAFVEYVRPEKGPRWYGNRR